MQAWRFGPPAWRTCGIRPDGTVECWGFGEQGETAAPAGQFQQLSAGRHHTCGVHIDGTIACWGSSVLHRLDAPAGQFERVDVTQVVGCGIRVNGSVACWGDNSSWLNNQTSELELDKVSLKFHDICGLRPDRSVLCIGDLAPLTPTGGFMDVASGRGFACGLRDDGT